MLIRNETYAIMATVQPQTSASLERSALQNLDQWLSTTVTSNHSAQNRGHRAEPPLKRPRSIEQPEELCDAVSCCRRCGDVLEEF